MTIIAEKILAFPAVTNTSEKILGKIWKYKNKVLKVKLNIEDIKKNEPKLS